MYYSLVPPERKTGKITKSSEKSPAHRVRDFFLL